jgi:hypothetical protein
MTDIKEMGNHFVEMLDIYEQENGSGQRELAIARTKMEEAVMWAVKAVT